MHIRMPLKNPKTAEHFQTSQWSMCNISFYLCIHNKQHIINVTIETLFFLFFGIFQLWSLTFLIQTVCVCCCFFFYFAPWSTLCDWEIFRTIITMISSKFVQHLLIVSRKNDEKLHRVKLSLIPTFNGMPKK